MIALLWPWATFLKPVWTVDIIYFVYTNFICMSITAVYLCYVNSLKQLSFSILNCSCISGVSLLLSFLPPSVSFPSLTPPFLSSFLPPFYLVICMCLWQKATQGRKTLAASLVLLELELWETMFSWVYNIKMMSKYKEMSESANLRNELWQLWIWVSKTRLFHYYLYQSAT